MGVLERIKEIEEEMARTQKNKATEYHLGLLKSRLARLRSQLLEGPKGQGKVFQPVFVSVLSCTDFYLCSQKKKDLKL
jgi:ribosome-interacting GTPase 1